MLLAIFVAKPKNEVAIAMLASIKHQFIIVVVKTIVFCFFTCYAYNIKKKGTPAELRSWLYKCFLISLAVFLGMYSLFIVEFIFYATMKSDPDSAPVEYDSIFCIKLLFWEMLAIYTLMLIYGLFNYKFLKERSLSKLDDIEMKEGGMTEITAKKIEAKPLCNESADNEVKN